MEFDGANFDVMLQLESKSICVEQLGQFICQIRCYFNLLSYWLSKYWHAISYFLNFSYLKNLRIFYKLVLKLVLKLLLSSLILKLCFLSIHCRRLECGRRSRQLGFWRRVYKRKEQHCGYWA